MKDEKPAGANVVDFMPRRLLASPSNAEIARHTLRDILLEIHAAAGHQQEVRLRVVEALEVLDLENGTAGS